MKLACVFALLLAAACSAADDGVLSGRITGKDGAPITQAMVLVHAANGAAPAQTIRVDSDGVFSIRVAAGVYDVFVSAEGFEPASTKVELRPGKTFDYSPTMAAFKPPPSEKLAAALPTKRESAKDAASTTTWGAPDVDSAIPPVEPDGVCRLADVIEGAGIRAEELFANLPKFAATETMQHFDYQGSGKWAPPKTVVFDYSVEMNRLRNGTPSMEEYRNGGIAVHKFPGGLATLGLPIVAMVFHPYFAPEFDMTCEGIGKWDGRRAYQVRFQHRPDKVPNLRALSRGNELYRLRLKGRAWIDAGSYQPLHIETDLMQSVPQLGLNSEHLSVDYRPVRFEKDNSELWLQQTAEVYVHFGGRRFRRLHTFKDFMIFGVDTTQQVTLPKEP